MKKIVYSIVAVIGMIPAIASATTIKAEEDEVLKHDQNKAVFEDNTGCSGNILILDRRGNVVKNISFSSNATNLRDCIATYDLAIAEITTTLQQGETTGGTVGYN